MVKRNKVVAMLMAGLMAVSPISQPVSIYASESDVETVVQEEPLKKSRKSLLQSQKYQMNPQN